MKKIFYTFILLVLAGVANAQALLEEDFNYGSTADTLTNSSIGGNSWKRHSGTGGPIPYLTTSLSYSGYPSSGTGGSVNLINASASREDANIAVNSITSGTVYASFLLNVTSGGGSTGDYFFHLNDSQGTGIGTTFRGKVWVKNGSTTGTFKLGLSKGAAVGSAVFSSDYNLNTTYAIVLKYVFNTATSSDDSVYAWIFSSTIPSSESTPDLVATDISQSDLSRVRSICLRQGSTGTDTCTIDGIRVGTTWNDAPLPVKYISFTATKSKNLATLNWSTASEINNSRFDVQRSSNGKTFETIGTIKGAGNSNSILNYEFTDAITPKGTSYYRLKQIDSDGNFEYSKTVSVTIINEVPKHIKQTTPNPFTNDLNIKVNADVAGVASIEVIDVLGKVNYSTTEALSAGDNNIDINTSTLNNGVYFVRVTINGETSTQKIVKK